MDFDEAVVRLAAGKLAGQYAHSIRDAIGEAAKAVEESMDILVDSQERIQEKFSQR